MNLYDVGRLTMLMELKNRLLLLLFILTIGNISLAGEVEPGVTFPALSATLGAQHESDIQSVIAHLQAHPQTQLLILAPMDANANSAYWRHLGRLRAYAIFYELTQKGIAAARITIQSGGHIFRENIADGPRRGNRVRFVFKDEAVAALKEDSSSEAADPGSISFAYDSVEISEAERHKLDQFAQALRLHKDLKAHIAGHTDLRGQSPFNRMLGRLRALVVYEALTRRGVAPEKLSTESLGQQKPLVNAKGGEADGRNRRVEIQLDPKMESYAVQKTEPITETPASEPAEGAEEAGENFAPWFLGAGFGLVQARGPLADRLDGGTGASIFAGYSLLNLRERTHLYGIAELSSAQLSQSSDRQDNKLKDLDLSVGPMLDHRLSPQWSVLGHIDVGLSSWQAESRQKTLRQSQNNSGTDLLFDAGLTLAYRFSESWRVSGRGLFRTVAGDFGGGYQTWTLGLLWEVQP